MDEIEQVYAVRFDERDRSRKERLWRVLCQSFLQRYVGEQDRVLDLGAGCCEFINHIRCRTRFALDLNPATARFAAPGVTVYQASAVAMPMFQDGSLNVVFCSNFFEHLPNKAALTGVLREVWRILVGQGCLLIIQPNIRYAYREYWDFIDHHLPLSHLTMKEALLSTGFAIVRLDARFLPYTTKSRLPQTELLLRIYLRAPILWRLCGKQMLIVARKEEPGT